jgi:HK97 family phage major capsid protein
MDKKELMQELENLKSALQTAATAEAKSQIEAKMAELKSKLDEIETLKAQIVVLKDAADKNQEALDGLIAAKNAKSATTEVKTFNSMLMDGIKENEDKIRTLKKGQSVSFEMKAVADMTFANNFSTADNSVTTVRPGIIELPKRKLHIRQLLQGGTMGGSNFAYVKEVAGEEAPETVAEGAAKNQFDLDFQEAEVKAEYIAGYIRMSKKMLDDVTGMTTFLQSRLMEKLLRVEDDQILNGDGTSPNLSGITDSGNFTAASGGTIDVEQLVYAISQLENLDREANGILLNPSDYWRIALTKGATSGDYSLPSGIVTVGEGGILRIGGVPVYRSTAVTVDKFIVGDWVMGANLLTREAPRVEFFYEDGNNVTKNQVTVRVEERVAMPIYGNDYFIYGDFGNAS